VKKLSGARVAASGPGPLKAYKGNGQSRHLDQLQDRLVFETTPAVCFDIPLMPRRVLGFKFGQRSLISHVASEASTAVVVRADRVGPSDVPRGGTNLALCGKRNIILVPGGWRQSDDLFLLCSGNRFLPLTHITSKFRLRPR